MLEVQEGRQRRLADPPDRTATTRTRRKLAARLQAAAAVAVPTLLVGLHGLAYGRWIVDDAAITFAYARSMASGLGPVLQPGAAPVEGYSNPAWLALLVVGRWLGLFDHGEWFGVPDYVAFPKALALLLVAVMFAGFYRAARALTRHPATVTVAAGGLVAAVPSFVIWTMSGLENSLLAVTTVWLAALLASAAAEGRLLTLSTAAVCGVLAAVAALTRPDGLIYAGAYPLVVLVLLRRQHVARALGRSLLSVGVFAVVFGAYLTWRVVTFGELLPNTALAKAQGLPGVEALARPGELAGYLGWLVVAVALLIIGASLAMAGPGRAGLVAALVPLGLAVTAYAVLLPDWMGEYRFATPVWALGALATVTAAARVLPGLRWGPRTLAGAVAVAAVVSAATPLVDAAQRFRAEPTAPLCLVAQNAGRNFNGYADTLGTADATLLAPDVGGAALTGRARIVDLAGLADATMARFWRAGDFTRLRDHVFDQVRPTFIKAHGPWLHGTGLAADPRLDRDYLVIGSTEGTTDWVRRDSVASPELLAAVRRYAAQVAIPADAAARVSPRASCGAVLRVG